MKFIRGIAALSIALISLGGLATAGVNFDVGVLWQPQWDDDVQVYLHASNVSYPAPRAHVQEVFSQMTAPDQDYPVLAFIAHRVGVDIRMVWSYRQSRHSWSEVMAHFGVKPNALFVHELPRDPGPPYGKAWGHWRKRGNKMKTRHLSDDDVRFWVGIRTVSDYSGMSPTATWERHEDGERYQHVAGVHYRASKAGQNARNDAGKKSSHGKGHGKDK